MSKTALLADDEPWIVELLSEVLKPMGYDSVLFHSSASSLMALQEAKKPFDLVITDVNMGDGADGVLVALESKKIFPNTPVIVMSGFDLNKAFSALENRVAYLQKPFEVSTLMALVKAATARVAMTA